ncbi:MAG: hypothetical protein AAGC78_02450 [Cellvibrio sp.]|uniref:hypothetical protein n=1 Tax=Cellvibrio sp. TaxID=1965322 RepID=UPI0031A6FA15
MKIKGAYAPFIILVCLQVKRLIMHLEKVMKPLAIIMLGLMASFAYADDKCGSAVDEADSMNVNKKNCDYSDEGLNGFLQKAFKKGEEGAVLSTSQAKESAGVKSDQPALRKTNETLSTAANFLLSTEVDQWANVPVARNQLLPKAMEKCERGFAVHQENYRPLPMGRIGLSIVFSCL